jgi:hypothetical protein
MSAGLLCIPGIEIHLHTHKGKTRVPSTLQRGIGLLCGQTPMQGYSESPHRSERTISVVCFYLFHCLQLSRSSVVAGGLQKKHQDNTLSMTTVLPAPSACRWCSEVKRKIKPRSSQIIWAAKAHTLSASNGDATQLLDVAAAVQSLSPRV